MVKITTFYPVSCAFKFSFHRSTSSFDCFWLATNSFLKVMHRVFLSQQEVQCKNKGIGHTFESCTSILSLILVIHPNAVISKIHSDIKSHVANRFYLQISIVGSHWLHREHPNQAGTKSRPTIKSLSHLWHWRIRVRSCVTDICLIGFPSIRLVGPACFCFFFSTFNPAWSDLNCFETKTIRTDWSVSITIQFVLCLNSFRPTTAQFSWAACNQRASVISSWLFPECVHDLIGSTHDYQASTFRSLSISTQPLIDNRTVRFDSDAVSTRITLPHYKNRTRIIPIVIPD